MISLKSAALAAALAGLAVSSAGEEFNIWGQGGDPLLEKYEELFDKPFPSRSFDAFNRLRPFADVQEFNRQFDLRAAGVWSRVDEEPGRVLLLVSLPDSAGRALDVSVEGRMVRFRMGTPDPVAIGPWRFRSARPRQRELPVPAAANASGAQVFREGDLVRVIFPRK